MRAPCLMTSLKFINSGDLLGVRTVYAHTLEYQWRCVWLMTALTLSVLTMVTGISSKSYFMEFKRLNGQHLTDFLCFIFEAFVTRWLINKQIWRNILRGTIFEASLKRLFIDDRNYITCSTNLSGLVCRSQIALITLIIQIMTNNSRPFCLPLWLATHINRL